MMSMGWMLPLPMVPSYTSVLPIASIASRNKSAIKGAYSVVSERQSSSRGRQVCNTVTKFIGNCKRTSWVLRPGILNSVSPSSSRMSSLGPRMRVRRIAAESHSRHTRGNGIGRWKGKSTMISKTNVSGLLSEFGSCQLTRYNEYNECYYRAPLFDVVDAADG